MQDSHASMGRVFAGVPQKTLRLHTFCTALRPTFAYKCVSVWCGTSQGELSGERAIRKIDISLCIRLSDNAITIGRGV